MKVLTIGEILWDVFPQGEHLGGAVFNCSAHLARLGHEVIFLSAVGGDERGHRALRLMKRLRLSTDWTRTVFDAATGYVSVTVDAAGQPTFVIHRPAAYDYARVDDSTLQRLAELDPEWIVFGTLFQIFPRTRELTARVCETCSRAKRFYDVNLRRDSYTPELVRELLGFADVVKLNDDEVAAVASMLGQPGVPAETFCRENAARFGWEAACVTHGADGCTVFQNGEVVRAPGYRVRVADTVGAGDAFAAAFLHGLSSGWPAREIGDFANRAGALVASRQGGTPEWTIAELQAIGQDR